MKTFNIYIDFGGSDSNKEFANKLKERLNIIKEKCDVILYTDLPQSEFEYDEWERHTIEAIDKANVVIPILSPLYLGYVSSRIEKKFDEIIESSDKYLFPIYYESSNWSSFKWVVKSKLVPTDNIALADYPIKEADKLINDFINTINNIIIKYYSVSKPAESNFTLKKEQKIIFISHDHEDADFAELLKLKLEKNNIIGWIDSERLKIGADWRQEIDDGIASSIAVIAIMTPDARKSEYVTYEWAFAWGKGLKIFPIMLKQTQLHPRLESLQYIDFTNRAARPWDKLIEYIKELM